jgi:DNA ligase-1
MIFIKNLVEVSENVSSTTRKKEKVSILASFLKPARERDIALAASCLAAQIPQGLLGIGWANIQGALKGLDQKTRPVGLMEIDKTFERVFQESGAGSARRKLKHLQGLFSSVAKEEKDFLIRLIMGEIRQGALEGLILEAIAEASSVPSERVRQGLMFSGDIGEVARVALEEGSAGLL